MDEPLANSADEQPNNDETPGRRRRRAITLACMLIAAGLVAAVTPDDNALTKPYAYISAALGGLYFVAWSVSFWPQVLLNKQRKTTVGLSPDFAVLNAFAFAAYSAYTVSLYASPQIRHQYKRHHARAPEVRFADVLFCLHALLLSSVTVGQISYYDGFATQAPSRPARYGLVALVLYVAGTAVLSREALQILYALSYCRNQCRIVSVALARRGDALPRRWHHLRAVAPTRKQRRRAAPSKSAGGGIQRINTHRQDGRHVLQVRAATPSEL